MKKECPKCKETFVCNNKNIEDCHCAKVILTDKQKAWITEKYNGCLCNKCLKQINNNILK